MEGEIRPFISVVIPVYNDASRLRKTLRALKDQNYPDDRYEIFVVDNGSEDESVEMALAHSRVTLLCEHDHLSSPYSARNRGIEAASGSLIALLDATCVPTQDWLEQGSRYFSETDADLVGGAVQFELGEDPSCAELYDSFFNIKVKESIKRRQVVPTANVFVERQVFEDVGLFPEGVRSGADLRWTGQATAKGYKLIYGGEAVVYKSTRGLGGLIRKQWRVGKGRPEIWKQQGRGIGITKILILSIVPPSVSKIWDRIEGTINNDLISLFCMWLIFYILKFVRRMGEGYKMVRFYIGLDILNTK